MSNSHSRYTRMEIGEPPQEIEIDLNMLVSDLSILTTSSRKGSRYDDFFSQSNGIHLASLS